MSDISLTWQTFAADFTIAANDLQTDAGLESAVLISLFTDRRATLNDVIPDGTDDRRGWWGDSFPAVAADLIGSRLWLLHREKELQTVLNRAQEYGREALQWMIDDRVLARIDVTAEVVRRGVLGLLVVPYRPDGRSTQFRYELNWRQQALKVM
jgi:phage gp46-like protein